MLTMVVIILVLSILQALASAWSIGWGLATTRRIRRESLEATAEHEKVMAAMDAAGRELDVQIRSAVRPAAGRPWSG